VLQFSRIPRFVLFLIPAALAASITFLGVREQKSSTGQVAGVSTGPAQQASASLLPVEVQHVPFGERSLDRYFVTAGVMVYPEDKVRSIPPLEFGMGGEVIIERATPVKVFDANVEHLYRTWQVTLAALLQEKQVSLGEMDAIEPALETSLTPNLEARITRVEETELKLIESIAYETVEKEDPGLERGKTRVEQEGALGQKELTYKVRRENGKEVKRTLTTTNVTRQPQKKVVAKGTKTVILGEGIATWYGAPALVAAHNTLPRGKKVLVRNLSNGKTVVVTIVGGGIKGRAIIDLSPDAFAAISSGGLGAGILNVRLEEP
jgi:hypothetical protein